MRNQHTSPRRHTLFTIECSSCREMKLYEDYHNDKSNKYGVAYYCKACATSKSRSYHKKRMENNDVTYKDAKRSTYLNQRYGITAKQYEDKLTEQHHKCAICKVKLLSRGSGTHLDHCHNTGKLRAMLCTNCNRGLGHFQDNPSLLEAAAEYLNNHRLDED